MLSESFSMLSFAVQAVRCPIPYVAFPDGVSLFSSSFLVVHSATAAVSTHHTPGICSLHHLFRSSCPSLSGTDSASFFTSCCTSTVWFLRVISFTRSLNFFIALAEGFIRLPGLNSCPKNTNVSLRLFTIFVFSGCTVNPSSFSSSRTTDCRTRFAPFSVRQQMTKSSAYCVSLCPRLIISRSSGWR